MKNCEYYQELISRLLDDDLTAQENAALKSHLDSCEECRMMYEAFSDISDIITGDMEEPPEALHESIMAEIRRAEIKKKNSRLRPLLTAAACFALVLLGVFGLKNTLFAAKATAMSAMAIAAPTEDAPCEATPEEAPAALPVPKMPRGQNNMLFAAAAPVSETTDEGRNAAETEQECADCSNEASEGEYIILNDAESFETLCALLDGEPAQPEQNSRLICTAVCEENGNSIQIYERDDGTLLYTDSRDGCWYTSSCSIEEFDIIFSEISGK